MGGEDEGGDHAEVEGEGEREDRLDRIQLQHRHTLVVRQGHLYSTLHCGNHPCGSGSSIRCLLWPLDPARKKIRFRKKTSRNIFPKACNNFRG
jgi:hypothetical protein